MPTPAASAPWQASTAAPGTCEPATTPRTPREYLWERRPGRGSKRGSPSASKRRRAGSGRAASMPIGITWTRPAKSAPGSASSPALAAPKVTVRSARRTGLWASPVSASTPLGMSQATTSPGRERPSASISSAAGPRSPPCAPVPSTASMTTPACGGRARRCHVVRGQADHPAAGLFQGRESLGRGLPRGEDRRRPHAAAGQHGGREQPVPAVVALAGEDRDAGAVEALPAARSSRTTALASP